MSSFLKYCPHVLLYTLIGAWFLYFLQPMCYIVQVRRIKTEQRRITRNRNQDDNTKLVQLSIAVKEFEKIHDKSEGELSLNGDMYDIISYSSDCDTVHCVVIEDEAESKLFGQYSKNIDGKHSRMRIPLGFFWAYASYDSTTLPGPIAFLPLDPQTPETGDKPSCGYGRFISEPPETLLT
jgi:hypothetical protein